MNIAVLKPSRLPTFLPGVKLLREVKNSNFNEELNLLFLWTCAKVFGICLTFKLVRLTKWLANGGKARTHISFAPDLPRPWYDIWNVMQWLNISHRADTRGPLAMAFRDETEVSYPTFSAGRVINGSCTDVSKTAVGNAYAKVFGQPLTVNPLKHHGPMVEKSEINGLHNGRIVQGPLAEAQPEHAYQHLIDNSIDGELVQDIRAIICGPEIVFCYVKQRPLDDRFANSNSRVRWHQTDEMLSDTEQQQVLGLCRVLGLDYGGVDVLRDNADGQIYIVDVNKTTMGLPIDLPLVQKLNSTAALARAFERHFLTTD